MPTNLQVKRFAWVIVGFLGTIFCNMKVLQVTHKVWICVGRGGVSLWCQPRLMIRPDLRSLCNMAGAGLHAGNGLQHTALSPRRSLPPVPSQSFHRTPASRCTAPLTHLLSPTFLTKSAPRCLTYCLPPCPNRYNHSPCSTPTSRPSLHSSTPLVLPHLPPPCPNRGYNRNSLQYSNVETFITFRSSTPLVLSLCDYFFLGRAWPNTRSW